MLDALVNEAQIRWGLDLSQGLQVVPGEWLAAVPVEPSRPLILAPLGSSAGAGPGHTAGAAPGHTAGVGPRHVADRGPGASDALPGRHGPRGLTGLDVLRRLYPADHVVGRFGAQESTTIAGLTEADLAGRLFVGPVPADQRQASPWALPWISNRLRAPDGCPWDREQTHESLRRHLLEEAYEVYDALGEGASPALAGELGDLLLQVVLHAQLAAEEGIFDLTDVYEAIGSKIVRRHPHVFGESEARTAGDVNRQWEQIKKAEREQERESADAPEATPPKGALDGISRSLPALAASQEMQERAANFGYDWPTIDGIVDKVQEELGELLAASSAEERREELGDLLMVIVNLGRRQGVEAESALRAGNEKLRRRFRSVERQAAERGVELRDLDFATMDAMWDAAKAEERT